VYVDGKESRQVSIHSQLRVVYISSDRTTASSQRVSYIG